jgi:hypothetical protein
MDESTVEQIKRQAHVTNGHALLDALRESVGGDCDWIVQYDESEPGAAVFVVDDRSHVLRVQTASRDSAEGGTTECDIDWLSRERFYCHATRYLAGNKGQDGEMSYRVCFRGEAGDVELLTGQGQPGAAPEPGDAVLFAQALIQSRS